MMRWAVIIALLLPLGGCMTNMDDLGTAPDLSPVGSGIDKVNADRAAFSYPESEISSSWVGSNADLFRDQKARRQGDIITVLIDIDDKASLNNNSNRSRKSKADGSLDFTYQLMGIVGSDVEGSMSGDSNSSSAGQGTTARSEKVRLSVAAVVVDVLPNGLCLVQGSQEVLVNYESRVLRVEGVVNPNDISSDNRVAYEKIAEARISYGGRGRLTEMQQPGWGQQLWDKVTPF